MRFRRAVDRLLIPVWAAARFVYGIAPRRPERNPMEFVLFVALFLGTFRTAIGAEALPGSLTKVPEALGQGAAIAVAVGALISAVGLCWTSEDDRLLIEQFGLTVLGVALLMYGVALVNASSWDQAAIAASLAGGVSLGTGARFAQIAWYFRQKKGRS